MSEDHDSGEYLRPVAAESIDAFTKVAEAARAELGDRATGAGVTSFAYINTLTSGSAVKHRGQIEEANVGGYRTLMREPAIARVVVVDDQGQKFTYYFCRATPVPLRGSDLKFASYRSPVGRLAELGVGDEYIVRQSGRDVPVEVIEHARFVPILLNQEWDARNSVLIGENYGPLSVESLRALLQAEEAIDATALDDLLREESAASNIREGVRRAVISKMDLRDQPVLDRYQGEIFRMPLGSRLLILGAPGTGKTTTLIRRLGQKLDLAVLDDDERRSVSKGSETDHARSWVMFTPTDLLKLYVKEAFNREGIPAPDDRIRTWAEFRESLARNDFRILRSAASSSSLVMRDNAQTLSEGLEANQIAWFSDFEQWQRDSFWDDLSVAAKNLAHNSSIDVAKLGGAVLAIVDASDSSRHPRALSSLMAIASDVETLVRSMKESSDGEIRRSLNLQVNRDRQFLDVMAAFINELGELTDDDVDQESDDDEESRQPRTGRAAAAAAYMRAVRVQARARARKRGVPRTTLTGRLIEWLDDRVLAEGDLVKIGESLIVQSELRVFVNPVRRYIDGIPGRYRRFRRVRQGESRWYRNDLTSQADVHPLEVDLMLLVMMRSTDELIGTAHGRLEAETAARGTLERMTGLYRTQVFVDEATDFSPIQLACMVTLARPGTRSFFACGDFNQRVTSWGTRSRDEMKWVLPDIEIKSIRVAYRQSRQLHDLARQLVIHSGDNEDDAVLPDYVENEGVPPVLAKGMADIRDTASWLAARIIEIESFVRELPSIAVLVNTEEEVRIVAAALGDELINHNISVEACPDGKVRGRDGAVRVFNVQHIKGLEFEAVFFVNIDELAHSYPDLFDKYLYVGATRAATYLGLTCGTELPFSLASLEGVFGKNWS